MNSCFSTFFEMVSICQGCINAFNVVDLSSNRIKALNVTGLIKLVNRLSHEKRGKGGNPGVLKELVLVESSGPYWTYVFKRSSGSHEHRWPGFKMIEIFHNRLDIFGVIGFLFNLVMIPTF